MDRSTLLRAMHGRVLRFLIGSVAALQISCGGSDAAPVVDPPFTVQSLTDAQRQEVLKPFLWADLGSGDANARFKSMLDAGDPLQVTTFLMQEWAAQSDVALTSARIDSVAARWQLDTPAGKFTYPYAFTVRPGVSLPAGWRSAMDSWAFPLLVLQVRQAGGSERLQTLADKLIATAAADVSAGGVVWRDAKGCWLSEYAFDGMTQANEFYVLNGHLYALQAVRMIAEITRKADHEALYACAVRGTKARAGDYALGSNWMRYMLQPSVINPTHYIAFESMQFDALYKLDPDSFFAGEAQLRRDLLQRYFPVIARQGAGVARLVFSAIGPPHPYEVDIYPTQLTCDDGTRQETHSLATPTLKSGFIDAPTALDPTRARCRVDARYAGLTHVLYEAPVLALAEPAPTARELPATISADSDAALVNPTTIDIDPARVVPPPGGSLPDDADKLGRVVFDLIEPSLWAPGAMVGIEFETDGALAIGVTVASGGVEYFRYYPRTPSSGKTVVLLSPQGFEGGEAIDRIERATLLVYTEQQSARVTLRAPRLLRLDDPLELYEYMRTEAPGVPTP